MQDVTGAYLAYQVHPGHAGLVDEVIDWYDGSAGRNDDILDDHVARRSEQDR